MVQFVKSLIYLAYHVITTFIRSIGRFSFNFNPGPFNIKEHCLIVIMASTGGGSAYATDILAIQVRRRLHPAE
jgi:hypothetical protein